MNSIKKYFLAGCIGLLFAGGVTAQDSVAVYSEKPFTWTLQDCIDWAKKQNITIQRNKVNVRSSALDLENAKNNRLPTVNFSSNQQLGYRPFQETHSAVIGNEIISSNNRASYSGSYGLNASMSLYDGGQIKNNIRLAEINSQIAELNVLASELTIEEQITQLYVQILYSQDALRQDDELIALGQTQLDRAKALKKAGLLNKADVSQLESQLAQDKYQKVADETTLDNYRLQLKQLMELDGDENLTLADPHLEADVLAELPSKQLVYQHAVETRPELKVQQLAMDRTYIDEKIAEAAGKPNVSASAGINPAQEPVEQRRGRDAEHPHLGPRQDQKRRRQGPSRARNDLSGHDRHPKELVEDHRELLATGAQQPAALHRCQGERGLLPRELQLDQ